MHKIPKIITLTSIWAIYVAGEVLVGKNLQEGVVGFSSGSQGNFPLLNVLVQSEVSILRYFLRNFFRKKLPFSADF